MKRISKKEGDRFIFSAFFINRCQCQKNKSVPFSLIITAEHDVLTGEGEAMAEALKEAGVETTYSCYPGMIHLFYGMGALTEEENGLAETGRWYRGEQG